MDRAIRSTVILRFFLNRRRIPMYTDNDTFFCSFNSLLFNQNRYIGYYGTLIVEALACSTHPAGVLSLASIYLGMCFYINAMVNDMKEQIIAIEAIQRKKSDTTIYSRLMTEIQFHSDIIE